MPSEATEFYEMDEDIEAGEADEGDESDEAFMSAEGDEADEAGESDEADEGDEGDEFGEGDEADEVSYAYASRVAARDRARAADWQRRVSSTQRADAIRAQATQRNLSNRLQRASRTGTRAAPAMHGAGVVTLRLPNGRATRAMISPRPALANEVNQLRNVLAQNDKRQAQAIARLSSAQAAAVQQITKAQISSDRTLGQRMVEGYNRVDKRITQEVTDQKTALEKHRKRMLAAVGRAETRQMWNTVLVGTSAPLWAMFADRSDLTADRNVKMLAANAFWFYSDELLGKFAGKKKDVTQGLAWAAVAGNIATMLFLAKDEQLERFVSGTADLPAGGTLELKPSELGVAKEYEADFKKITNPRVAVTYLGPPTSGTPAPLQASWKDGALTITGTAAKVAFIVDTWTNNGE